MLKRRAINRIFISSVAIFIVITLASLNLIQNKKVYQITDYNNSYKEAIYTLNSDNYVSKGYIYVLKDNTLDKVRILLDTMIEKNNKNALLPSYFKPILPQNTKVLNVLLENKIIKINFSKEFLNASPEQIEKMIEAITYTLTELDDINGVELYVLDSLVKYIKNSKEILPTILTRDIGINKKYDLTSSSNINKVVLYFLGSNNNLVPITKYTNEQKEKVLIIIDNLTKDYILYENLISVVPRNLKLNNYYFSDKTLMLSFDKTDYDIKEDDLFIDMLTYSMFDNYDIDKVVFDINNKKIEKIKK